ILGPEMNVAPGRMERPDFEHDEIERAEPFANRPIFSREPRIAAEEHRMPRGADHKRRPQGRVAVFHCASGEVLRRPGSHAKSGVGHAVRLPPVEFDNALGANTPRLEMRTDAE